MKYIRTKEGKIIDFQPTKPKYENDVMTLDWLIANYCGGKNNVVKIADTIEELCDEFVLESEDHKGYLLIHNVIELDNKIFDDIKTLKDMYKNIRGAIWTNNGLIYVAKMNEKGELELL